MPSLAEKYRPTTWQEVAGQDRALLQIENLRKRGLGGRAFWLAGPSGTGKSSIAGLLASEVAGEWGTEHIDGARLTPLDVEQCVRKSRSKPIGAKGWCFIVDEAHGLRKDTLTSLLLATDPLLKPIPDYVVWVFCTTLKGQNTLFEGKIDASPMCSRCIRLDMESSGQSVELAFAVRLRHVAQSEGLDGQPIEEYLRLVRADGFNMRSCLQRIDAGAW